MATAEPFSAPRSLPVSSFQAVSCALVFRERTTLPPACCSPVNMPLIRSAKRRSLAPERSSFSLRSMPTSARFTGLYPMTGAYSFLSG